MKIAVSGAHRTGKSALIEELGEQLPDHTSVDEPYHLLEEEGHEFAEMPSLEDFELQLERSIECVSGDEDSQIFDRCPADILAYLITHRDSDDVELDDWIPRVRRAMQRLDLVVFVPIESPDRVVLDADEEDLRRRVDEELRDILLNDRWDFGVDVLEVAGTPRERARQVMVHIGDLAT